MGTGKAGGKTVNMLTSEAAGFLARIITGGLLGSAALWVAFGPELMRILGRVGWRADAANRGSDSEAA